MEEIYLTNDVLVRPRTVAVDGIAVTIGEGGTVSREKRRWSVVCDPMTFTVEMEIRCEETRGEEERLRNAAVAALVGSGKPGAKGYRAPNRVEYRALLEQCRDVVAKLVSELLLPANPEWTTETVKARLSPEGMWPIVNFFSQRRWLERGQEIPAREAEEPPEPKPSPRPSTAGAESEEPSAAGVR